MTRIVAKLILLFGLLSACSSPSLLRAEGHHQSGIVGQILISNKPLQCHIAVKSDEGAFITEFETDANGLFKVALKPGIYLLVPDFSPGAGIAVSVERKQYRHMLLLFGLGSGTIKWVS